MSWYVLEIDNVEYYTVDSRVCELPLDGVEECHKLLGKGRETYKQRGLRGSVCEYWTCRSLWVRSGRASFDRC